MITRFACLRCTLACPHAPPTRCDSCNHPRGDPRSRLRLVACHSKDYSSRPPSLTPSLYPHTYNTHKLSHTPHADHAPCTRASHRTRSLRFLRSRSRFSLLASPRYDPRIPHPNPLATHASHCFASLRRIHARARRTSGLERTLLALVLSPSLISSPLLLSVCG